MKRVLVSGATGFIGGAVVRALCARGDSVAALTRRPATTEQLFGQAVRSIEWNPQAQVAAVAELAEADAIIHLAGRPAVGVRHTERVKRQIYESRVAGTRQLVRSIAALAPERRPKVLVSASAVGYYGNRSPDERLDETASPGEGFMAEVCVAWEAAAQQARELGLRVVTPRLGIVLGPGGGALHAMRQPFRWGVGGTLGSGEQVVSWIHLNDVVRVLLLCLDDERSSGPVNATAPGPVTNGALTHAIGRVLERPTWFRVPEIVLRGALGSGAAPLLEGQCVWPGVLHALGFSWEFPDVDSALRASL